MNIENIIDKFQEDKFNEIFDISSKIVNNIKIMKINKNKILDNLKTDVKNSNRNINNIVNRLHLINTKIESLNSDLNKLNCDYDMFMNQELDKKSKEILKDTEYTKFVMKPFLPYILYYSIINIDKFNDDAYIQEIN